MSSAYGAKVSEKLSHGIGTDAPAMSVVTLIANS